MTVGPGGFANAVPAGGIGIVAAAGTGLASFRPYDTSLREDVYRRAVEGLRPGAADVVAAPEIGAVGYYCPARVLDVNGIVSPEATEFELARQRRTGRRGSGGGVPPGFLEEFAPRYLVALDVFLVTMLREEPGALDGYREVAFLPTSIWNARGVSVYRRTDGRAPR